ncbi:MAG: SusC/RagA family TonB-linked outer membrane protein [Flavobacteriaceae bacterium]|nr:SusC/RagA family TonB-linked outer membrane protein [Flavobacteriaceae bacterium]
MENKILKKDRKSKLLLGVMTVFFLMSTTLITNVFAQSVDKKFSISFKDKSVPFILDYIGKLSNHQIKYGSDVKLYDKTFTISFNNVDGEKAIKSLLLKTPFTYELKRGVFRVFKLNELEKSSYEVTGVLKDSKGKTIPFATVQVKGTKVGNVTDMDGRFDLKVPKKQGKLIFSSLGYEEKTIAYTSGVDLQVTLKEKVNQLEDVTIVAYGKRSTRKVVGSISSVKVDRIKNTPTSSVQSLLQGQVSGVEVSNVSGGPGGGGAQIRIRGLNSLGSQSSGEEGVIDGSPLFVIDGVPVKSSASKMTGGINTLAGLDPSSIQSVEVLKDAASAALYGSRAGNGVVLITTKKGKSGKVNFTINASQSYSYLPATPLQISGKGERKLFEMLAKKQRIGHYDWMTGKVVMPKTHKETWGWAPSRDGAYDYYWKNGNVVGKEGIPLQAQDSLNSFYNNSTNWWKYAFRLALVKDVSLQVSGGSENSRYLINAGVYDEEGIMIGSSFLRGSVLANLDFNLTPKLEAFFRTNLAYTDKSAGSDSGKIQGLTFDPKRTSTLLPGKGTIAEKEALKDLRDTKRENSNYNVRLNAGFKYKMLKGLSLSSSVALDHYFTRSYTFVPDYLTYDKRSNVMANNFAMTMLQSENILNYKFDVGRKHNFDLLAGITYNKDLLQIVGGTAKGGPTNQVIYVGDGWPKLIETNGYTENMQTLLTDKQEQRMLSFLGRIAYSYKQKYLAEASIRRDGSSVFGKNVRWGTFPAIALGWAFSSEEFMRDFWWLDFGKIRASWGRSGQKFEQAYLAHGVMQETNTFFGFLGLAPAFMANNELTWEKSDQYDIGLDLDMFNRRLKLKFDYYYKYSDALLMQTPTPGNFFYANKMWNNSSAISNEGIEFEATIDIIKKEDFQWTTSFNISRNWNLLRKTYGDVDLKEKVLGRPISGIYTYKDEGIVQKESEIPYYYNQFGQKKPLYFQTEDYPLRVGGRKIKDQNSDGKIDSDDLYYAGSTLPKAYGGIVNVIRWKNFMLTATMNYSLGRKVMNMVKNSAFLFDGTFKAVMNDYRNVSFWENPGDNADYPSMEFADSGYIGQYDGNIDSNIETIHFIRMKQLNLSYKLPKEWFGKIGVSEARVFLSGENIFMLSNYSGLDPEVINPNTGKDTGDMYPLSRKFTIGANIKF